MSYLNETMTKMQGGNTGRYNNYFTELPTITFKTTERGCMVE